MWKRLFSLESDHEHQSGPAQQEDSRVDSRHFLNRLGSRLERQFSNEEILALGIGTVGVATMLTSEIVDTVVANETATDLMTIGGAAGVVMGGLVYVIDLVSRPRK